MTAPKLDRVWIVTTKRGPIAVTERRLIVAALCRAIA